MKVFVTFVLESAFPAKTRPPSTHAKWQQRCAAVQAGRHARREAAFDLELQAKLEAAFGPTDPAPPLLLRPPRGSLGCPRFLSGSRCALR